MIFKSLKFEAVRQTNKLGEVPTYLREEVSELLCSPGYGVSSIRTVSGFECAVDPLYISILQFTGQFDKDGQEIYHAHLLADEAGDIYEVVAYNGGFHIHREDERLELNDENCMKLKIIGDSIQNAKLLMPENAEDIIDKSHERAIDKGQDDKTVYTLKAKEL